MVSNNEDRAAVAAKLIRVMEAVGAIEKTQVNQHQKYKYRGIDDVYANLQPALRDVGLAIIPSVQSVETEIIPGDKGAMNKTMMVVNYLLVDTDTGASIEASCAGEGFDKSDKATNKAWTAAFKYFVFQVLCIPTENSVDADSESPERPPTINATQYANLMRRIDEAANGDAEVKSALTLVVKDAVKSEFGTTGKNIPASGYDKAVELVEQAIKAI